MILETLQKSDTDCCIRLVISSIALGMGADLRHISRIIHAGPPTTMEAYVQEVGRAGREDMQAQAILFYNSSDLGVKHIRAEMKNYCQTKKCLREVINEFFGFSTEIKPLNCCSVCQSELSIEWDFGNLLL
ncbi:ATP-dependent DNA helicase RecQ-like [Ruditapes philippinarum]|uniref:ATP-dependent DNA helicase RecQ-like n=1 Tax=Ruditapes philippinarum TaxID=129788 RepID=UPI00295B54D3|nr:ATP-dependent DNA helicase RecQ-like [Ruditapes philippinarum]